MGDSGCSTSDTHVDTRGQWVTVSAVLAIHIWIHVASGDRGCSAADTHMDTGGRWVTVAAVLLILIWIHVVSG